MAVVGILAALLERAKSGRGQLVETDMVRLEPHLRSTVPWN